MRGPAKKYAVLISTLVLKYRWPTMLVLALMAFFLELAEHRPIVLNHLDAGFLRETLVFALILPITWGFLLSLLAHSEGERQTAIHSLDQQQVLGQKLSGISTWGELMGTIVRFPGSIVPLNATYLYVYNPSSKQYELEDQWLKNRPSQYEVPHILDDTCRACQSLSASNPAIISSCQKLNLRSHGLSPMCCLPIVYANAPIALLQLEFSTAITLTSNQLRLLSSAAPEIALAIENAQSRRRAILQAQANEFERKRIAQNLHDTLGQNIAYLRLKLDQLTGQDAFEEITNIRFDLERMRATAEDAYQQVRGTLADLRANGPADFTAALLERARQAENRAHFVTQFTQEGTPFPLSPISRLQALYICQEAFNNIEKHSQAKNVHVNVKWELNQVIINISDDGLGFNLAVPPPIGHYGLEIMHERADEIGGKLVIKSSPNKGTEITLQIPSQEIDEH